MTRQVQKQQCSRRRNNYAIVRIDLQKGKTTEFARPVSNIVSQAIIETVNVPANDRFQVITQHEKEDLIYDPEYLGIQRTNEILFIQIP